MINKFSCHNFRNIFTDDLEFEKINILIGPNNSGKSNFIKAITFFSEMLKNSREGNSQEFNYFRCHDGKIGRGQVSTAIKGEVKIVD